MDLNLRPGKPEDAPACATIAYRAFKTIAERHGFPPDFTSPDIALKLLSWVLSRGDVYSVLAESRGRIVGSNFLWEGDCIAGVGPVTVDPEVQNASVGRRMMENVLERAQKQRFAGVRLAQSAYHNRSMSLYTKLGFDAREPLSCLQGQPLSLTIAGHSVRAATESDVQSCNGLCLAVHGHDRSGELRGAIQQNRAHVVEHDGRITGYTTGVGFFGHTVAETDEDLKALIGAAPGFEGLGMLVPTRNSKLLRWSLAHGLRIVQPLTLMSMGLYNEPRGAFLPSILF